RDVWANYRDESFVTQFLSPAVMRRLGLFHVVDDADAPFLTVESIHNERGYRDLRRTLSRQYDITRLEPDIQIVDVDLEGDRRLILHHQVQDGIMLDEDDSEMVLRHLADLWGYEVVLREVDEAEGRVLDEHTAEPNDPFM
ncbi:MAG: SpoVR family protein, partial [Caulobacterales bacterium]|nr:SpoVR family protein [Caulobacterales bacterium]